jgi:hypothetical protein
MADGLMSLWNPVNPLGRPVSFGDALASQRSSLVGLGLGLMGGGWAGGMRGYEQGAQTDAANAYRNQQLLEHAADRAQRQSQFGQEMELRRKQFELTSQLPEARQANLLGYQPGTPEYQKFLESKYGPEGQWQIVDFGTKMDPNKMWVNMKTRERYPVDATGLPPTPARPTTTPPTPGTAVFAEPPPVGVPGGVYAGALPAPGASGPYEPAATPAQPQRNDAYLERLGPNMRTVVKGVADYEIDPMSIDAAERPGVLAAAKNYRPDYSMAEYQKRGNPPSGEVAGRIGLARGFMGRLEDQTDQAGNVIPGLRSRIASGELSSARGRILAQVGQGGPGEIRRAIDEGADALERALTGAAMPASEANTYARRYQYQPWDTQETQMRKLNELDNALRHAFTEVGKGRGGEDFLKSFRSQFGQAVTPRSPLYPNANVRPRGGAAAAAIPSGGGIVRWGRDAQGNPVRLEQ